MLHMANQYVNAEEADQRHKDNVVWTSWSDRLPRRNDDRREKRRYNDRDRRHDDRLETSRAG